MSSDKMPDSNRSVQYLANERTFLAWLRTSIALIALGFVVSRFGLFLRELGIAVKGNNNSILGSSLSSLHYPSSWLGVSMVVLGAIMMVYALKNYLRTDKSIEKGTYVPKHSSMYVATTSLVVFSIIIVVYLFSL
jgi:inner membrane protein YidH